MTRPQHNIRRSNAEWHAIFARYENSGQTQRDFCKAEGVALSSFLRWRRRLGPTVMTSSVSAKHTAAPAESPFVELIAAPSDQSWTIELELPGGCVLRVRA